MARRSSSTTPSSRRTVRTRDHRNSRRGPFRLPRGPDESRLRDGASMNFTDIFIRKPVLATTVSLLILVLGARALTSLSVRQYPRTQNAVVTVSTAYYGADAQTVAGFITQPLEAAIAQAQGIDYLSSTSSTGVSTIQATLRLNYDANK